MSSSSKQLNRFYMGKVKAGYNGDDDDRADSFDDSNNTERSGDDDDMEELLKQEGQPPRRSKGGFLPVRNLTAVQKQQLYRDTQWRRNSYCCILLVAAFVAALSLHPKNGTSFANKEDRKANGNITGTAAIAPSGPDVAKKPVLEPTTQAPTKPKTGSPSKFATRKPVVSSALKRDGSTAPAADPTTIRPTTIPKTGFPTRFATRKPTVPLTSPPKADASPVRVAAANTAPSTTTNSPTTVPKTGSPTRFATRKPTVPITPKTAVLTVPAADPTTTTTTTTTPGQAANSTTESSSTTNSPMTKPKTGAPTRFATKKPTVPITRAT